MSDFGLDLPLVHSGKVRRLYALPDDRLLMVATDAISAYDHVLATTIPDKGAVLTQLSLWWFGQLGAEHHVVSTDVPDAVAGRAVVVEKLDMVPVECVARGYLTGSGWAEYQASGTVCGIPLPEGLVDGSRLPEPVFTPAVKAPVGEHDENVTYERVVELHGEELAAALRDTTLDLYRRAEQIARERGIILADTKFEFGRRPDGTLVLADEVLTPDSSRFWDAAGWVPGEALPSFDKQFVRDWLTQDSGWDKASDAPPPALPDEVVAATRGRYVEAFERLTGRPFQSAPAANLLVGGARSASAQAEATPAEPAASGSARGVVGIASVTEQPAEGARRAVVHCGLEAIEVSDTSQLDGVDALVVAGGPGAEREGTVLEALVRAADEHGLPILGIGRGFQVLCAAGLLPGALVANQEGTFLCRDQRVRVETRDTVWTCDFADGQEITLVFADAEGAYTTDDATLAGLEAGNQVVFRFLGTNPSGSRDAIAGVTNERGTVVGVMAHPEYAVEALTGPSTDGRALFTSVRDFLKAASS